MSSVLDSNIEKAARALERFRAAPLAHFIDGRPQRGRHAELLDDLSPID
jgi:hypothetical protein